jgi:prepilin-type N-terminal cleavage/methylation domain-containing protein
MNYLKLKSGFTLVELMVTVTLIGLFVSMASFYNRTADKQIALYREQAKVVNAIYKARSLAIATYSKSTDAKSNVCGYGIHIASSTSLVIFEVLPSLSGECGPSYSYDSAGDFETINLLGVKINTLNGDISYDNVDIIFIPPDPKVYSNKILPVALKLEASSDATINLQISINQFGQITVQ